MIPTLNPDHGSQPVPRAGGYSENYTATLDSVEVYDPNTQAWSLAPPMPTPRGDLMCTTLNGALVVIGGYYDPTGGLAGNCRRPLFSGRVEHVLCWVDAQV